jgi:uncharacterized protein (TIGR02231 family)
VHANGDFTILSIKTEPDNLLEPVKQKNIEDLQAQQKAIRDKIAFQNVLLNIDQQEEQTMMRNLVTPQNTVVDVMKLTQMLDFQTKRLTEIKKREIEVNEQINTLNAELQKLSAQIIEITYNGNKNTNTIFVTVSSKTALQSTFTLNYVVNNASWHASYDMRAKNVNSPITIAYKANVSQQTGEDWKNVKLNLSTGNPSVNGVKPELNPYYLNFIAYAPPAPMADASLNEVVVTGYGAKRKDYNYTTPLQMEQIENQTNMEFSIENPFSIPSDGKPYVVEINNIELPAEYKYAVAPKISTDVFLTAQLTDWSKYNFLTGPANVFFEGTYVGRSFINTNIGTDTLNLSLGRDKAITVNRILQKEFTEKKVLGQNRKDTRDWLIQVMNHKTQKINLLVEDQLPVSQNSSIEIDPQDLSGGNLNKVTGKVSWNITLNSQGEKKLDLKYQVRYPKNQLLTVQ